MFGWKRSSDTFYLTLNYGLEEFPEDHNRTSASETSSPPSPKSGTESHSQQQKDQELGLGFRIDLEWVSGDREDQVALKLQSQLIVALPSPQDFVTLDLRCRENGGEESVGVEMKVVKRTEPLLGVVMTKAGYGQQSDGVGVLLRLFRFNLVNDEVVDGSASRFADHWRNVTLLSLCSCGISELPAEILRLPCLEKLYLDYNKLTSLPDELNQMKDLKVLSVDYNMLVSVPELKKCVSLVELSLEYNKLVRPILDFRGMAELQTLRLFGNPMEFLPEILPLKKLCHLTLANIRIVADENFRAVNVHIEMENSSYFSPSKQKLSAFLSLVFRFSSCHHPLLASALARIMEDEGNCWMIGKDENAVRQLISMITSGNRHVVEQACWALSTLAGDVSMAMQLMKCDIMKPMEAVLKSEAQDHVIPVLQFLGNLAFVSDIVAQKILSENILKSLKFLCGHNSAEVQRLALIAVGNLAFCLENRHVLVTSESLRDLLLHLTVASEPRVKKAAARALAILGENENVRHAVKGRPVPSQGLRILSMDGGGMKGLATVQILKAIEKGTGKRIHELFDLVCGTSTGGMLAVALGIKLMTLGECEDIYKNLGKLVFADSGPKDSEAASWREKLDMLYKSSSQSFRVVVHGSKHSADEFERLLKEMCADEDGDLLIDSAVKNIPKVFAVSTLVSMMPAQPFIFRNYQYPVGTPEASSATSENQPLSPTKEAHVGYKRVTSMGGCKYHVWKAIRASSAAPYYLDDFSDGVNRWQDGAIVANNPTIFAIREAQLLWPGTKIDCLVSVGCGSVPVKVRKGGWRYLDTGQVLIESACSVDRVEEALSSLLQMLPDIHYFRFNPVDERCDMELDETDPAVWLKLEAAVDEYMMENYEALENVCERLLLPFQREETFSNLELHELQKAGTPNPGKGRLSIGWRRNVLLVEALHRPDSGRIMHHARALESFCSWNGIKLSLFHGVSGLSKKGSETFLSLFNSPVITGTFPSVHHLYSPDLGPKKPTDMAPPVSPGEKAGPTSPLSREKFCLPVQSLHEKLQNSSQVGIIHLALQNDSVGSILSWQNDVLVVAEPGDLADKFLQSVKHSMLSMIDSCDSKLESLIDNLSTIADLVRFGPYFQVGNVVHRYIGGQTQVLENDQEIAAYVFRRTIPSYHLKPDDVRWMVGSWRDRIIIFTGTYGPTPKLIKAFLDSGAMAVICPPPEPHDMLQTPFQEGSGELDTSERERSETGKENEDIAEPEPINPAGDKEDKENYMSFWEDKEKDLSQLVCDLYHTLFREGARVDDALRRALASHPNLRYSCHLPRYS